MDVSHFSEKMADRAGAINVWYVALITGIHSACFCFLTAVADCSDKDEVSEYGHFPVMTPANEYLTWRRSGHRG